MQVARNKNRLILTSCIYILKRIYCRKTKYMKASAAEGRRIFESLGGDGSVFEGMSEFTYLRVIYNT